MTQTEVIRYFSQKFRELKDEYEFTTNDHSPCHIETKEDIIYYINDLAKNLFEEEDYPFVHHTNYKRSRSFTAPAVDTKSLGLWFELIRKYVQVSVSTRDV